MNLRRSPPAPRWPLLHRWRRFLVPMGALTVTVTVAVTVARMRRRRTRLAESQVPDVLRGDRPPWRSTAARVHTTPAAQRMLAPPPVSSATSAPVSGAEVALDRRFPAFAGFAALPTFPVFPALPEHVVVPADDDLDTQGAGRPVPAAQAAQELREENRFETGVFVRSILILVAIALALTARMIWLG